MRCCVQISKHYERISKSVEEMILTTPHVWSYLDWPLNVTYGSRVGL